MSDDEPKEIVADILSKLSIDGKKIERMPDSLYCEDPPLTRENPINLLGRLVEDIEAMGRYSGKVNYAIKKIDVVIRPGLILITLHYQNDSISKTSHTSVDSLLKHLIKCFNLNIEHFMSVKCRFEAVDRIVQGTHKIYNKIANDLQEEKK